MRIKPPARTAAGPLGVIKALEKTIEQMGPAQAFTVLTSVNQREGFDCPSCAWPDPDHRSKAEFCENGAKAVADEATERRVTPEFFARWSIPELAEQSDYWLNLQGRLTHPMVRRPGATHYEPLSWDEAFRLIARELQALPSPHQALFYTSGRTSNEAAFLYQLFVRMFGTNNLPDCSNMCHESSGEALRESIGVGKGTVQLEDFAQADAIFLLGQNPGTNHPRMLTTLQEAARRGCQIVTINPLPEAGLLGFKHPQEAAGWVGAATPLSTLHLPVRINGDHALLRGIAKELLAAEDEQPGAVLDHAFLQEHTACFAEYAAAVRATPWESIVGQSGISRELIRQAAAVAMRSERTIACWAMGLTQHRNAVATIQEVVNLLLLRGQIGRPGAGVCPVRGHSNVQGDRTMGIWERMPDAFLDRLGAEFGFTPPREHGLDTVNGIRAMRDGRATVFFGLGGNFLSATPDTELTASALRRCRLTAHVSTKLNRSHLVTGELALILPCLGRTERDAQAAGQQFVTVENSMGVVSRSQGVLAPASEHLRSEVAIVAGLAGAVLGQDWSGYAADYSRIRERIARVVPGFADFSARIQQGSMLLPNAARERVWHTVSGKAQFAAQDLRPVPVAEDEFLMMTIRSHDQFNTTVYGLDDRYRGVYEERRVVLMNQDDLRARGWRQGQAVELSSESCGQRRIARDFVAIPYELPSGCVATYFPEANVLIPVDAVAERSNTPASKSVLVRISAQ